jgi:hypothetical protein
MSPIQQMLLGVGGSKQSNGFIDELFAPNTYLGTGTSSSSTQNIYNGVGTSAGGMVWIKERNSGNSSVIYDTARGGTKYLRSNTDAGQTTASGSMGSGLTFLSNGFRVHGDDGAQNQDEGNKYSAWSFKESKHFFAVCSWTGNGAGSRQISHSLESVPGSIWIKRTDGDYGWYIYHRGLDSSNPERYYLRLNETNASQNTTGQQWMAAAPTATNFTLAADIAGSGWEGLNTNGQTYVAYVFGHNSGGNGEFGPDINADVIQCGSYSGDGQTDRLVNCGFEPQFVLVKRTDASSDWVIDDTMKGMGSFDDQFSGIYYPNKSEAMLDYGPMYTDPLGFRFNDDFGNWGEANNSSGHYIYIAIAARTGKTAVVPTTGNDALAMNYGVSSGAPTVVNAQGWSIDMILQKANTGDANLYNANRTMGELGLYTMDNAAAFDFSNSKWDYYPYGWNKHTGGTPNYLFYMFKRGQCFDCFHYKGLGSAGSTINHNLGGTPEMIIIKQLTSTYNWKVYHSNLNGGTNPDDYAIELNSDQAESYGNGMLNLTPPTATQVTLGSSASVNSSSHKYVMYLFRSVSGISKFGGYTGNGSSSGPTISLGFQARFVAIKCTNSSSTHWRVIFIDPSDNAQKYTSFNNPASGFTSSSLLTINSTSIQLASSDNTVNGNTNKYIYWAQA